MLPIQAPLTIGGCRGNASGFRGEIDDVGIMLWNWIRFLCYLITACVCECVRACVRMCVRMCVCVRV